MNTKTSELRFILRGYGFGFDVTRDIDSNVNLDTGQPYAHIDVGVFEKYDGRIRDLLKDKRVAFDTTDKGIAIYLREDVA